jgi:hypothetical protein
MVSADVLQGRRNLRLQEMRPAPEVVAGDPVLSLLGVIEEHLTEIRARLVALDDRLDRLQASLAGRNVPEPELQAEPALEPEFVVCWWSAGGSEFESQRGPLPEPGEVAGDAGEAIVLNIGRSPFGGDDRPCVFVLSLEP